MKAKIKLNGKEILIEDIKKVSWLGKFTGLMFRRNSPALLFEIKNKPIHSFFCYPFIAVWLLGGKIIDYKIIDSLNWRIMPEKEFDKLIEIPITSKYQHLLEFFVDE